jgi:hypothetical protein
MAMPMHDVSLDEVPASRDDDCATEQPISGTHARRPAAVAAPAPAPSPRPSPDEEAMQLMMKVVERVEVAKSFAKIAAGIFTVTAARATVQLRAVADAKMIARAAKDAAVHVATHRPKAATTETTSHPTE